MWRQLLRQLPYLEAALKAMCRRLFMQVMPSRLQIVGSSCNAFLSYGFLSKNGLDSSWRLLKLTVKQSALFTFTIIIPQHKILKGECVTGGVLHDGLIANQTAKGVRSVFAPKTSGAFNLESASAGVALHAFVTFSSVAAFIGSAGQASYVSANAAMDDLVRCLDASGKPGRCIDTSIQLHALRRTHRICNWQAMP